MKNILILFLLSSSFCYGKTRVLFLGDSLTEGYGVEKKAAFPHQLEVLLKQKNKVIEVVNAGSSGSTSASALSRLKWHLKKKPDVLFLALGANDGLRGVKASVIKMNLDETIKLAQENEIKVVLAGMKLPINFGKTYIKNFEDVFVKLAKEYQLTFIPFLLKDVGTRKDLNLADGIHPNEKGHVKIAQNIVSYFLEIL